MSADRYGAASHLSTHVPHRVFVSSALLLEDLDGAFGSKDEQFDLRRSASSFTSFIAGKRPYTQRATPD